MGRSIRSQHDGPVLRGTPRGRRHDDLPAAAIGRPHVQDAPAPAFRTLPSLRNHHQCRRGRGTTSAGGVEGPPGAVAAGRHGRRAPGPARRLQAELAGPDDGGRQRRRVVGRRPRLEAAAVVPLHREAREDRRRRCRQHQAAGRAQRDRAVGPRLPDHAGVQRAGAVPDQDPVSRRGPTCWSGTCRRTGRCRPA
ncbi:hypothetical protein PVAP13_2NG107846 [Panicum virgatum]|uniref:Uncharacterized protein n=1 Tax=Panicum virgatum TaxID=38727 RepID=A0A8T0VE58_PANVG|nr:hypothetical protein PVAP13_2NG107846 [Panicum virgatum]